MDGLGSFAKLLRAVYGALNLAGQSCQYEAEGEQKQTDKNGADHTGSCYSYSQQNGCEQDGSQYSQKDQIQDSTLFGTGTGSGLHGRGKNQNGKKNDRNTEKDPEEYRRNCDDSGDLQERCNDPDDQAGYQRKYSTIAFVMAAARRHEFSPPTTIYGEEHE